MLLALQQRQVRLRLSLPLAMRLCQPPLQRRLLLLEVRRRRIPHIPHPAQLRVVRCGEGGAVALVLFRQRAALLVRLLQRVRALALHPRHLVLQRANALLALLAQLMHVPHRALQRVLVLRQPRHRLGLQVLDEGDVVLLRLHLHLLVRPVQLLHRLRVPRHDGIHLCLHAADGGARQLGRHVGHGRCAGRLRDSRFALVGQHRACMHLHRARLRGWQCTFHYRGNFVAARHFAAAAAAVRGCGSAGRPLSLRRPGQLDARVFTLAARGLHRYSRPSGQPRSTCSLGTGITAGLHG